MADRASGTHACSRLPDMGQLKRKRQVSNAFCQHKFCGWLLASEKGMAASKRREPVVVSATVSGSEAELNSQEHFNSQEGGSRSFR